MKIFPERFYSSIEAQEITGIKSRQYIAKYVKQKKLMAIVTGEGAGTRYLILGTWLKDFNKRLKSGELLGKSFTQEQINKMLKEAIK